ncbi:hypothetical protein T439DRAFT_17130 [Meredithblackwellia eburnea MCA 4105]
MSSGKTVVDLWTTYRVESTPLANLRGLPGAFHLSFTAFLLACVHSLAFFVRPDDMIFDVVA